jgi:uncharacterized protein (UPF0333 family)
MKKVLIPIILIAVVGLFYFMYQDTVKKFESMKEYISKDAAWSKAVAENAIEKGRPYSTELIVATTRALDDNVWLTIFGMLGLIKTISY